MSLKSQLYKNEMQPLNRSCKSKFQAGLFRDLPKHLLQTVLLYRIASNDQSPVLTWPPAEHGSFIAGMRIPHAQAVLEGHSRAELGPNMDASAAYSMLPLGLPHRILVKRTLLLNFRSISLVYEYAVYSRKHPPDSNHPTLKHQQHVGLRTLRPHHHLQPPQSLRRLRGAQLRSWLRCQYLPPSSPPSPIPRPSSYSHARQQWSFLLIPTFCPAH